MLSIYIFIYMKTYALFLNPRTLEFNICIIIPQNTQFWKIKNKGYILKISVKIELNNWMEITE